MKKTNLLVGMLILASSLSSFALDEGCMQRLMELEINIKTQARDESEAHTYEFLLDERQIAEFGIESALDKINVSKSKSAARTIEVENSRKAFVDKCLK